MVTVERREKKLWVFLEREAVLEALLYPHIAGSDGWVFSRQCFNLAS